LTVLVFGAVFWLLIVFGLFWGFSFRFKEGFYGEVKYGFLGCWFGKTGNGRLMELYRVE